MVAMSTPPRLCSMSTLLAAILEMIYQVLESPSSEIFVAPE
jgi:hypothetical protein